MDVVGRLILSIPYSLGAIVCLVCFPTWFSRGMTWRDWVNAAYTLAVVAFCLALIRSVWM